MSEIAIRVENLSKQYRIGQTHQRNDTLRDALMSGWRQLRRFPISRDSTPEIPETFWALRNVSFEVQQGEVVGIIGRNGAGKSTLLKILSRITEPTDGWAELRGRIGALLEVGTGFHPELTGRENILLSGAMLGMSRQEINRQFEEIVDFSGVEKFIDTPVKRYSSGMNVRLGFAVAAHLEPEILLVDEVLAVGDAAFQRKCLGKMGAVAKVGRTVLFVSHNMAAVGTLCNRTILLNDGIIERSGLSSEIIDYYLSQAQAAVTKRISQLDDEDKGFTLTKELSAVTVIGGSPIEICYEVTCPNPCRHATSGLVVHDLYGEPIFGASSKFQGIHGEGSSTTWKIRSQLGEIPLNSGNYLVSIWFGDEDRDHARFSEAISLHISQSDPFAWGNSVPKSWGAFYWKPKWQIEAKS